MVSLGLPGKPAQSHQHPSRDMNRKYKRQMTTSEIWMRRARSLLYSTERRDGSKSSCGTRRFGNKRNSVTGKFEVNIVTCTSFFFFFFPHNKQILDCSKDFTRSSSHLPPVRESRALCVERATGRLTRACTPQLNTRESRRIGYEALRAKRTTQTQACKDTLPSLPHIALLFLLCRGGCCQGSE